MHDDDEPEDPTGRIYYSDINLEADRADYALPRGEPALQDGDAEYPAESSAGFTRRGLMSYGLGVGLIGLSAAYLGGVIATGSQPDRRKDAPTSGDPKVSPPAPWVEKYLSASRKVAVGSREELVYSYGTFIMFVESHGGQDATLWHGVERLCEFVRHGRDEKGFKIAVRLLEGFERNPPPDHLRHLKLELEDFVSVWKKTHR